MQNRYIDDYKKKLQAFLREQTKDKNNMLQLPYTDKQVNAIVRFIFANLKFLLKKKYVLDIKGVGMFYMDARKLIEDWEKHLMDLDETKLGDDPLQKRHKNFTKKNRKDNLNTQPVKL